VELIEPAGRTVAAKSADIDFAVHTTGLQQARKLGAMVILQRLVHAIRTETFYRAANVKMCLIDRIAERLARVAKHHEASRLRHERG